MTEKLIKVFIKSFIDFEKFIIKLKEAREFLLKSNVIENIARSAIISYILTNFKSSDKKSIELINEFLNIFLEKNIIENSLTNLNEIFYEPSPFKEMISFRKNISKEKQYLEFYFKIMMIQQNIPDILEGIKFLLNIKSEKIENQISKLSFQNPYSIIFIRELINDLITDQNNINDDVLLKNINNYLKKYYLFRCPKCLKMLYVSFLDNINLICYKDKFALFPKSINELNNTLYFELECVNCHNNIEIYENNFKCLKCDKYYCNKCAEEHEKANIDNILINIYEIDFFCEEHCELFSTFCGLCNSNLCKICKDKHYHKVNIKLYELNENLININLKKNIDEVSKLDEYISIKLSFIYECMKNFSYNNLSIRLSIWFNETYKRISNINSSKFYFNKFFDENFQNYYSLLINNVSQGKYEYYNLLLSIKQKYEESKKTIDSSFLIFEKNYFEKKSDRRFDIFDFTSKIREALISLDFNNKIFRLDNKTIKLNNKSKKLQNDNELLKIKILSLLKSKNLYSSYLIKFINRYIADFLIRKIIERYPNNFNPIKISNKNFYEIVNNFKDLNKKIFNNYLSDIRNKIGDSFNDLEEKDKIKKIGEFIDNIKDKNKIIFINPLELHNELFSVDEMNFVLETFFYFKSPGNIIAHINISPKESIKLKKIDSDIQNIDPFFSKLDNSNGLNGNNNLISTNNRTNTNLDINGIEQNNINNNISNVNIVKMIIDNIKNGIEDWLNIKNEIIKDTKNKFSEIQKQVLSDFYESSINEKLNIIDILNFIFKNDYSNIYKANSAFIRGLSLAIEDSMKEEKFNFEFSKYDEIKDDIFKALQNLKLFDEYKKSYKKLKLILPEKIHSHIKKYIKEYIKSLYSKNSETNIISLKDSYSHIIASLTKKNIPYDYLDKYEKGAIIISLIMQEILSIEIKNLNSFINNSRKSIKKYFVLKNTKIISEKLYESLKNDIDKKSSNDKDSFSDIKKYIMNKKDSNSYNVNMNVERLFYIIKKIFQNEDIEWTKLSYSNISLESLLFYYQNKNT